MKLLLDENLPKKLKFDFEEYEVYTIREKGWNGIKNGQLLQLLIENKFDALLTFDKNLQYQQNFAKYSMTVFVLSAPINTYFVLTQLTPKIKKYIFAGSMPKGTVIINLD
jgi:uncharacterized protein DUF5615